jgi:hypothetical protein
MSVQFPSVGATIYTTFNPTTTTNALNGINNALVAAGWTSVATRSSATINTSTGLPLNNGTFTIGGVTYTFQTVLNNAVANNILIAANTILQAQYISDAMNAVTGGGTEWSTPTVANPTVTASVSGTVVTFTSTGSGTGSNSSFTLTGDYGPAFGAGRGFVCTSATTPQGLAANVYLVDSASSQAVISVWWGSADGLLQSGGLNSGGGGSGATGYYGSIVITSGRTLTILANAFQFFTWLAGDNSTTGCQVGMCVPYLRAGQIAPAVSAVTNNSGLFEITTATAHGLTTGMNVSIWGVTGMPTLDGTWTITVIDSTHFTLNGSTFAGTYGGGGLVGGSGGAGNAGGISRCFFGWTDFIDTVTVGYQSTWRNLTGAQAGFVCVNEFNYGFNSQVGPERTRQIALIFTQPTPIQSYYNWGGYANSQEALVGWYAVSITGAFRGIGQFWGALIAGDSIPMDDVNIGYLGHNWINQTNFDGVGALWLATN